MTTSAKQCPHCNHVYEGEVGGDNYMSGVGSKSVGMSGDPHCSHLLCNSIIISRVNASYKRIGSITVNLKGIKVPLVIFLRFIKFLRERNSNSPQGGFNTIHQSKSRISNTFQGVTVFRTTHFTGINGIDSMIIDNQTGTSPNINRNIDGSNQYTIETTYYITSNPLNDLSFFESFIIKYYVDNFNPITLPLHIENYNNNNNNNNNNNSNNNNISNNTSPQICKQLEPITMPSISIKSNEIDNNNNNNYLNNSNNNNNNNQNQFIKITHQQLYELLQQSKSDDDDYVFNDDDSMDTNSQDDNNELNGRWILVSGIQSIPSFYFISNTCISKLTDQIQNSNNQNNENIILLPINHHNNNSNSNHDNSNRQFIKVSSIINLPSIAIQT